MNTSTQILVSITCLLLITLKNTSTETNNKEFEDSKIKKIQRIKDDEWHVEHLREADFTGNDNKKYCKGDRSKTKLEKYKEIMLRDPSLIEWVSADGLPVNEHDIQIGKEECIQEEVNDSLTNGRKAAEEGDEYLFSSVEYYDYEIQFDPEKHCPGIMQVINLDIDQLKKYDVECEQISKWKSLE